MIYCGVVVAIVATITTIWKNTINEAIHAQDFDHSSISYWVSYLEVYFAGISNVGKSVAGYELAGGGIYPLFSIGDMFRNVPFISSLVSDMECATYYFSKVWGRTDQVIPSVGNGLFYFGYIFAPIVPATTLSLAHYFEKKIYTTNSVSFIMIYVYMASVISYNAFNSISSLFMKLFISLLPPLVIIFINNKMSNQNKL
jgi:hypothetical protein